MPEGCALSVAREHAVLAVALGLVIVLAEVGLEWRVLGGWSPEGKGGIRNDQQAHRRLIQNGDDALELVAGCCTWVQVGEPRRVGTIGHEVHQRRRRIDKD